MLSYLKLIINLVIADWDCEYAFNFYPVMVSLYRCLASYFSYRLDV
jgi:hypothetical protein